MNLKFLTSNNLTLNHKRLIILSGMSLLNKWFPPLLKQEILFSIIIVLLDAYFCTNC